MIPLYRTSKMDETVCTLDATYERVMVRAIHKLEKPIRIRIKRLQDIHPFEGRDAPEFDREFDRWKEENGTMVNFRKFHKTESWYDYDAAFITEVPLSMDELESLYRGAKSLCVVFHPPVWRAHEELLFSMYPTAKGVKRFMQAVLAVKQTRDMASIALACGIPTAGTRGAGDVE